MKFLTSKPVLIILLILALGGGVTMAVKNYHKNADIRALNTIQEKQLEEIGAIKATVKTRDGLIDDLKGVNDELGQRVERLNEELAIKPTRIIAAEGSSDTELIIPSCPVHEPSEPEIVERVIPVKVEAKTTIVELETVERDLYIAGETDVTVSTKTDPTRVVLNTTVPFDETRTNFIQAQDGSLVGRRRTGAQLRSKCNIQLQSIRRAGIVTGYDKGT
jgi:hypothetical protein